MTTPRSNPRSKIPKRQMLYLHCRKLPKILNTIQSLTKTNSGKIKIPRKFMVRHNNSNHTCCITICNALRMYKGTSHISSINYSKDNNRVTGS